MRPTTFTSLELPVVTSIEPEPVSTCRFTVALTRRVRLNSPRAEAEANPESRTSVTRTVILEEIVADRIVPPLSFRVQGNSRACPERSVPRLALYKTEGGTSLGMTELFLAGCRKTRLTRKKVFAQPASTVSRKLMI